MPTCRKKGLSLNYLVTSLRENGFRRRKTGQPQCQAISNLSIRFSRASANNTPYWFNDTSERHVQLRCAAFTIPIARMTSLKKPLSRHFKVCLRCVTGQTLAGGCWGLCAARPHKLLNKITAAERQRVIPSWTAMPPVATSRLPNPSSCLNSSSDFPTRNALLSVCAISMGIQCKKSQTLPADPLGRSPNSCHAPMRDCMLG